MRYNHDTGAYEADDVMIAALQNLDDPVTADASQ